MVPSPQPVIQQHHHQQQQQQQMRSFNQVQQTVSPSLKDIPSDVWDFLGTLDDNQGRDGNGIFENVHQTTLGPSLMSSFILSLRGRL